MRKVRGDKPTNGDLFLFLCDNKAYQDWINDGDDNMIILRHLRKAAEIAIERELTDTQKEYLMLYFENGCKMCEIADLKGVNVSTVSRTIERAKRKLFWCLRYAAPWLLHAEL